ncbi:MAG: Trk system potassium transporter TrkA [Lachnospiraceae bacterium]|nr:Trk system potassium transporter TrkA [Lachnospiraceae bacterium]
MKIVIVGLGKVGMTLASELGAEENDITVIDTKADLVEEFSDEHDLMGIAGNGAIYSTQAEAGVENADLLIAVTDSDELNLLCCLIARKAGNCRTIARVRSPEYNGEINYIREELGLAMVINPELTAANEIACDLKYPYAAEVNSFVRNQVELLKFRLPENSALNGLRIADIPSKMKGNVLICAAERGEQLVIPDGNFVLKAGDFLSILGGNTDTNHFIRQAGIKSHRVKNILIVGGSSTAYYLAEILLRSGIHVKIIEKDQVRCDQLSETLPEATVVYGDGTDKELLLEENIQEYESFAALTNMDEENILLSLYAKKSGGQKKIFTKINRIAFDEVVRELDLDTVVHPNSITADRIIRYVRSMKSKPGSNVRTLHKIFSGRAEALEFSIQERSRVTETQIRHLPIRMGTLIACLYRNGKTIFPCGSDRIQLGDNVIVITQKSGLDDIDDILEG